MQWLAPRKIAGGGTKDTLLSLDGTIVATVVTLPGSVARGYIYVGTTTTVDEPNALLCKARVSDIVGLTSGAYRSERERQS